MNRRLGALKTILWAAIGVLTVVTAVRFRYGLGAVTNLSDATPWGLWVAFDVMAGVALAAGGFVVAATVHIFHLEEYRGFVRPAILTAFLGYVAVAVGLVYDLGLPWHIWHPAVYPQHHSVLFEVAACVMLYLTVLALEFAPTVLEHPVFGWRPFEVLHRALKWATIPLVIAGIVLSTLHQSSLGSLFLIAPHRLDPLWYSPIIYVLFLVSAIGLGLTTVIGESLLSAVFLGHRLHLRSLAGLGRAAAVVLWLYVALRLGDLALRGRLGGVLDGPHGGLFVAELGLSAIVPGTLLLFDKVRSSVAGLASAAGLTVFGMVMYRIDVCIVAFARPEGMGYVPTWMEFAVSAGIVAAAVLVFVFFAEHLNVFVGETIPAAEEREALTPGAVRSLLPTRLAAGRRHSFAAVAAVTIAVAVVPLGGPKPPPVPVKAPRTIAGWAMERGDSTRVLFVSSGPELIRLGVGPASSDGDLVSSPAGSFSFRLDPVRFGANPIGTGALVTLHAIDGNRDGRVVLFDHAAHQARDRADSSCATCHHLNLPYERGTSCVGCHRDMYEPTPLFDHTTHERALAAQGGCPECHDPTDQVKTLATAAPCTDCHDAPLPARSVIAAPAGTWRGAASYLDAMHGLCIECHREIAADSLLGGVTPPDQCAGCHDADIGEALKRLAPRRRAEAQASGGSK
jgi:Ni/Fe-hydrogenase subunit HybB-like protein